MWIVDEGKAKVARYFLALRQTNTEHKGGASWYTEGCVILIRITYTPGLQSGIFLRLTYKSNLHRVEHFFKVLHHMRFKIVNSIINWY